MLSNVKFVQEKRLISKFFDEISQDTGKFVFSVKDTLACLEMGAVETLIVWEALDCDRCALVCILVKCRVQNSGLGCV
jgi:peptide chain release factor subunit 1